MQPNLSFTSLGVSLLATVSLLCSACAVASKTAAPSATSAAATTPASGEPIEIGFVWGVTGAVAEIVRPTSEASRAYFDDLNRRGGIKGRPVRMVEIDSKYQVPLAQEGYKKVTTENHVPL